jgi:hypothetical protein
MIRTITPQALLKYRHYDRLAPVVRDGLLLPDELEQSCEFSTEYLATFFKQGRNEIVRTCGLESFEGGYASTDLRR